jgi:hypothetical protein
MNLMLALMALAQSTPPLLTADGDQVEPHAPRWGAPHSGLRVGFGVSGTLNVMAHSDLAGVSFAMHFDLSYKWGDFEARLAPTVTGFSGWNGHDGFGYLLTASAELSLRYYVWRFLAVGAGAMPGINVGEFQSCSVDVLGIGGGSWCSPDVKYLYGSITPVIYPFIATLGGDAQNELALQLSWPVAFDRSYTFPSVMVRYARMF